MKPAPRSDLDSADAQVAVGRVGRAHGLDGSFYVTMPLAPPLRAGAQVRVAGRPATIVRRAGTEKHPIVRLEGVDDRAGAEALRGSELSVARSEVPPLAEGEYWAHELEGCSVLAGERVLGVVRRMIELPSCEALEVLAPGGSEPLLIPLVKDAVRRISLDERRIEVSVDFLEFESARSGPGS